MGQSERVGRRAIIGLGSAGNLSAFRFAAALLLHRWQAADALQRHVDEEFFVAFANFCVLLAKASEQVLLLDVLVDLRSAFLEVCGPYQNLGDFRTQRLSFAGFI